MQISFMIAYFINLNIFENLIILKITENVFKTRAFIGKLEMWKRNIGDTDE